MRKELMIFALGLCFLDVSYANAGNEKLQSLSSSERNGIFTKFMQASGEECEVKENFFQGIDKSNSAYWSVRCSSKHSWVIQISNSGKTKIMSCDSMKQLLGNFQCFKKF